MNKGVIIGIIVAIIIVVGAVALAQDNESGTTVVTNVENSQREPQSFTVNLEEAVGMAEKP